MNVGDAARHPPVDFFGEGPPRVSGAEPRFDVADRHPVVERSQRRGDDGAGVALDQQQVGLHFAEGPGEGDQRAGGEIRQGLVGVGQPEVDVGCE